MGLNWRYIENFPGLGSLARIAYQGWALKFMV